MTGDIDVALMYAREAVKARLEALHVEAQELQAAFFSATERARKRLSRGRLGGEAAGLPAGVTLTIYLDGKRGRNSLSIRWLRVVWAGKINATTGRQRPSHRHVKMNRDRTYDLRRLQSLTPDWHVQLVIETEQALRPLRREAQILGSVTMRLATCRRDLATCGQCIASDAGRREHQE